MNSHRTRRRGSPLGAILLLLVVFAAGVAAGVLAVPRLTQWWGSTLAQPDPSASPSPGPEESLSPSPAPSPSLSSSPSPSLTPEEEAQAAREERARAILADMTLHEMACQLIIATPEDLGASTQVNSSFRAALEEYPVGGILFSRSNFQSQSQVAAFMADAQAASDIPLILTCDEEGGRVNRLMATVGTTWVGPMLDYKDQGADTARANAATIAADMAALGLNADMAPVADVWSNPANTVIGDRAYSDDFDQAAELVAAAVEGFHQGGVAATLKHFPGHGDTSADSHYGAVYVYKTLQQLREGELIPFQAGIDAGADMVMVGHLILPELDDQPAPFSRVIVEDLLREEMGFDGVVITDGLQMQAMTDYYTSAQIAVKAVGAGVDLLLCPLDYRAAADALVAAVEDGTLPRERLEESVMRVLCLKLERGMVE